MVKSKTIVKKRIQKATNSSLYREIKEMILIILGVLSAGMGLKGFLLPNGFLDGGVIGISLLLQLKTGIDLAILVVIVNIPFIWMGLRQVSWVFAIKTAIAIGLLALCLAFVPYPVVTTDKLLIAVFGGFFLGAGIGLAMRGGSVLDGTEVMAIYISRRSPLSVGDVIMVINVLIFGSAAIFISVETALYAMLTYMSAAKTVDFLIHGIEEYIAVMIVSDRHEELRQMITEELERGVTVLKGEKGFGKRGMRANDVNILYAVVTRLEITRLKDKISEVDEKAFLIEHSIADVKGGMIKSRPLH